MPLAMGCEGARPLEAQRPITFSVNLRRPEDHGPRALLHYS